MVDSIPPSFHRTFPIESEPHTTQVLFVSSDSHELEGNPPISTVQEGNPPIPVTQGGSSLVHTTPPQSSLVVSFD